MAENKNAKTPADGPDYERGFVDGMQHQMQLSVKINKQPTKIFGPGLEEILNRAGFYEKREWVGLTDEEIDILSCEMVKGDKSVNWLCKVLEAKLKEKNHG